MTTNIGFPEAIRLVAPRPAADATTHSPKNVAIVAATLTAMQDTGWAGDAGGCFVTFQASADLTIAFGSDATTITATTVNDFTLHAGVDKDIWIEKNTRYFKAFGGASGGTLKWTRSS